MLRNDGVNDELTWSAEQLVYFTVEINEVNASNAGNDVFERIDEIREAEGLEREREEVHEGGDEEELA